MRARFDRYAARFPPYAIMQVAYDYPGTNCAPISRLCSSMIRVLVDFKPCSSSLPRRKGTTANWDLLIQLAVKFSATFSIVEVYSESYTAPGKEVHAAPAAACSAILSAWAMEAATDRPAEKGSTCKDGLLFKRYQGPDYPRPWHSSLETKLARILSYGFQLVM